MRNLTNKQQKTASEFDNNNKLWILLKINRIIFTRNLTNKRQKTASEFDNKNNLLIK